MLQRVVVPLSLLLRTGLASAAPVLVLAFAAQPAVALEVRIDYSTVRPNPPGNWNSLATGNTVVADLTDYDTGSGTGIGVSGAGWGQTFSWSSSPVSWNGGAPLSWIEPLAAIDMINKGPGVTGLATVTLTGLNDGTNYTVEVLDNHSFNAGGPQDITVQGNFANGGPGGTGNFLGIPGQNGDDWHGWLGSSPSTPTENWLIWENVVSSGGSITISFQTSGATGEPSLNAIRLAGPTVPALPVSFSEATITETADGARSVHAVDIDGDGDLDTLSASTLDHTVAWYENALGDGSIWIRRVISDAAISATSVYSGDLDGDGDTDVLAAAAGLNQVLWYQNTAGDGSAWSAATIGTALGGQSVHAADVDGDGDLDALSASNGDSTFSWHENVDGDGSTWTERVISSTATGASSIYAGDLDGDGDMDVVASAASLGFIIWYDNLSGNGLSWSSAAISPAVGGQSVQVADIDGDGDLDALSASSDDDTFSWHQNDNGDASAWTEHVISDVAPGAASVFPGDVDGDGDVDVVACSWTFDSVLWFENVGGNGLSWVSSTLGSDSGLRSVHAGDVDGDGDLDILSAAESDDKVAWYENRLIHRNAVFDTVGVTAFSGGMGRRVVAAADLDGDGDLDLASGTDQIRWHENTAGDGSAWSPTVITTDPVWTEDISATDLDGDGDLDLLWVDGNTDEIDWAENTAGDASAWTVTNIPYTTLAEGTSALPRDIDGDGDLDIVTTAVSGALIWLENTAGDASAWTEDSITSHTFNWDSEAADIDGDGDLDILNMTGGGVWWFENTAGDGSTWIGPTVFGSLGGNRKAMAIGDIDGDGDVDVAICSEFLDEIEWYENQNGGTTWPEHTVTTTADGPWDLWLADIDGDGDLDVVSANEDGGDVGYYENSSGNGTTWAQGVVSDQIANSWDVTTADFDGDGREDVVAISGSQIRWFRNLGGQYSFTGADVGSGTIPEGEESALLEIVLTLHGRPGDSVGRLDTLELLLEDGDDIPLSAGQANALIDKLRVYRDDGSGVFEPGIDVLISPEIDNLNPIAGVETIALDPTEPAVLVAAPARFFVVGVMDPAASQSPDVLRVTHLSDGGSKVVDGGSGLTLYSAPSPNYQSQNLFSAPRFTVNDTGDATDANPGDGVCATAGAVCTLRAAIREADMTTSAEWIILDSQTYILGSQIPFANPIGKFTVVGQGVGQTVIGGSGDRIFEIVNGSNVKLQGLTLTGAVAAGDGGAIRIEDATVEITDCEIKQNTADTGFVGGGILVGPNGDLTLTRTAVLQNQADDGGGIYSVATTTITDSSFSENAAQSGGGALFLSGGTANITNSTISGNFALGADGGGLHATGDVSVTLDSVTITENDTPVGLGALRVDSASVDVLNTIIADNESLGTQPDCAGTINSQGHNLIRDTGGCTINGTTTGNITGVDPALTPLGDYGGPTLTHSVQPGSPAIDAGICTNVTTDQRGESRPKDIPGETNVADGCDIGAVETELGPTQAIVEVPVRWCGVRGAPSIETPSLVGEDHPNDVMRRRHERATQEIYVPQAGVLFRSGANENIANYPLLDDPDCVEGPPDVFTCETGQHGDVMLDVDVADSGEFKQLVASCRAAWNVGDDDIQGVTAIHIRRFVDANGEELNILGVGGRAVLGVESDQTVGARVMVVDNIFRINANPPDLIDRVLGHELGHALSLRHGDGVDNDDDGDLDNGDDAAVGQATFDGPNVMQYRNGTVLTAAQAARMRQHVDLTVPDTDIAPLNDTVPFDGELSEENSRLLQFGYDALTQIENSVILQFENSQLLQFENSQLLQFENSRILQFENSQLLQFENSRLLQFGMDSLPGGMTRVFGSTADLPWPAAIRPKTKYFFYLDLDRDDATGAFPPTRENPDDPGKNFPGANNLVGGPDLAQEVGVDLIVQVTITTSCPGQVCSSQSNVKAFDFNDNPGILEYEEVYSATSPSIGVSSAALYVDNGGEALEIDEIPTGINVQPEIPDAILAAASPGWVPGTPVRMEAVSTIECSGFVLNDDPTSVPADCQCTDCTLCPDYPGCTGMTGEPMTLTGTEILADCKAGEVTFEPPVLPSCSVSPQIAAEGAAVTIHVTDLPQPSTTVDIEIQIGETVLSPISTTLNASGGASISQDNGAQPITLPLGELGDVPVSVGILDSAERAECFVTVTPAPECPDNDGDEICDDVDPDDDNDGVLDGPDIDPTNPLVCQDLDTDLCDDCTNGSPDPNNDGPDFDGDGQCDLTDTDDDDDGVPDATDGDPFNPASCGDSDADNCEDCSIEAQPNPANDGPDNDLDGLCDIGDPDDDNDGTNDSGDCEPFDASVWAIPGEVPTTVALSHTRATGDTTIAWDAPVDLGSPVEVYDTIRTGAFNDFCSFALGLPPTATVFGTTQGQVQQPASLDCIEAIRAPGVWYEVHGTGNTITASTCNAGTDYDTIINVYCADCTNPTCVAANDDQSGAFDPACDTVDIGVNRGSTVSWCTQFGSKYYVHVQGFNETGNFELSLEDGASCGGGVTCNAEPNSCDVPRSVLTSGQTVAFSTTGSPNPSPPAFGCVVPLDSGPGFWLTAVGTGERMTATTCNPVTNFDTKLHVYCVNCANLTCVTGNDDDPAGNDPACDLGGGSFRRSTATWCSEEGATYRILVSGFNGASGLAQVTVGPTGQACNDAFSCRNVSVCEEKDGLDRQTIDPQAPQPGVLYRYLLRSTNACGLGSIGFQGPGGPERTPFTACP